MCEQNEKKNDNGVLHLTVPTELMNIRCECGNELVVDGKQPGWTINFHTGVDFNCPCGKVLTIKFATP